MVLPATLFLQPSAKGHEWLNGTTACFLIENESLKKKAVFDLGLRKDWWNLAPQSSAGFGQITVSINVETDVAEVIQKAGIPLEDINDLFWSHAHLDHIGDTSRFPPSAALNYGKEISALKPGYPDQPGFGLLASDFSGRINNEIDFSKSTFKIGGFSALDFYGDGSFYLLDTPGHAVGHFSALARTTSINTGKDTFVLLGGDVCHFSGMMRPNQSHPFPKSKFPGSALRVEDISNPDALLKRHPRFPAADPVEESRMTPWCFVSSAEHTAHEDPTTAQATLNQLRYAFDEADNVFVALAHDNNLLLKQGGKYVLPVLNESPEGDINGWYEAGWKEQLYWSWLGELGKEDKNGDIESMEPHVTGYWKDGKRYNKAAEILDEVKQQEALKV
ncbi:Cytochrome P450 monooxygenase mpaDE' [Cladobotryum mycophilum]|uniref:Cytochrome P450 monooxygenase mpaDE n=1 Tax=Cladobotryum mycophilum TaxID=491253 RepID=A0ABR0SRG8_9HYPO